MSYITVTTDPTLSHFAEAFEFWGHEVQELLREKLKLLGYELTDYIRDVALSGGALEIRTGKLRASIYNRYEEDDQVMASIVGTMGVPYAAVQETGGKGAYVIRPVEAKALHFFWQGKEWLLNSVMRKALPAKRYLSASLESYAGVISAELNAVLFKATQEGLTA